jgi:hypothetical protein
MLYRRRRRWRAGVAVVVLCLVIAAGAACGGDDDGDSAAASADRSAASGASAAFCDKAVEFEQATAAATGIASAEEMQSAVDKLNDVAGEAPAQMSDDFEVLIGVLERLVTAMRSVADGDTAGTVAAMQKVLTPETAAQVDDASQNVEAFLEVECHIEDDAAGDGPSTDPTAPPTSTRPGDPAALGADPALGPLAVACRDGDMISCDQLYFAAPAGSPYEAYGDTCGRRTTVDEFCVDLYPPSTRTSTTTVGPR